MPTYEYLCKTCDHRFEQWQKMTDTPLTTCPECGGYIRRVFYPAGIVFKGSGFYKTDHTNSSAANSSNGNGHKAKSENETAASTSESKSSSTETSSSTTKSENKAPATTK